MTDRGMAPIAELYHRGVVGFADRVAQVRADQWDAPTPCRDWDVRALVNHLVYEQRWSVPLFGGATIEEVGDRFDGDLLGSRPAATEADAARATIAAVEGDGALDRMVHLSFGDTPASEYVSQLLADHLVHAWDLAVAIGADRRLDAEAVQTCLDWYAGRQSLYRSAGLVADAVAVPAGADDQDRLIGAFGRDPRQ
jgi:uncharacterized protein (TIGR03086 family)